VANFKFEATAPQVFLVKTDILASSLALFTTDTVTFEVDLAKHNLLLQGQKSKYNLRISTDNLANFVTPEIENKPLLFQSTVITSEFVEAVKAALVAVGIPKNVYEPQFLNICFTIDNPNSRFLVVATDRFRVVKTVLPATFASVDEELQLERKNFLILPKSLQLLLSGLDNQEKVELDFYTDFLIAKIDQIELLLHYGDGQYPDYEKIIPQSFSCNFLINTKEIFEGLKQSYLFAKNNTINKSISVTTRPVEKELVITSKTDDGYSSETVLNLLNYEGEMESWTQAFNADFLLDYVNLTKTENILWEANPGKPSVLSPEKEKSKQQYLVSGLK
jgi:DNA polymerase-3 subunit beta